MISLHPDFYSPPNPMLWQGRHDTLTDERFFQWVKCLSLQDTTSETNQNGIAIIGFRSETGILRNEGRAGAAEGPLAIRQSLGRLACAKKMNLFDLGDVVVYNDDLETASATLAKVVALAHTMGLKSVVLGGGHEVAFGHYLGLASSTTRLGIINFDAHFDLRIPSPPHLGTSGTPFWQIAEYCKSAARTFQYGVLGIQPSANTASLYTSAKAHHVTFLEAIDIHQQSPAHTEAFLDDLLIHSDAIYLTICMDVFAEAFAPGVSAPTPLGLTPPQILPLLSKIAQSGKLLSFDVAETSPPLDTQNQTSKLAAELIAYILNRWV